MGSSRGACKARMRKAHCDKFEYVSSGESVDVVAIVEDFKSHFCHECSARNPIGYGLDEKKGRTRLDLN